jgi:hypothetical protein
MLAVVAMTLAGSVLNLAWLRALTGIGLVGWALYHLAYGARHRVRIGMQTGAMGLAVWSFLMANAHGAGMMIVPALIPLCLSGAQSAGDAALGAPLLSLTVVALHTATLLTTAGVIAMIVYDWVGVGFLRRGWINLDRIWAAALVGTGLILLVP